MSMLLSMLALVFHASILNHILSQAMQLYLTNLLKLMGYSNMLNISNYNFFI